ncbi:MAG: hypothetical protein ACI9UK_001203, partial [Candidatus Krumholzibacteriia bacterium]
MHFKTKDGPKAVLLYQVSGVKITTPAQTSLLLNA